MKNRIQKWGNSLAVRIPKPFAAELEWRENTPVAMSLDEGALVIRTDKDRAWDLEALLSGITDENVHPAWEAEAAAASGGDADGGDGKAGR
jgi:antitoxin MazE